MAVNPKEARELESLRQWFNGLPVMRHTGVRCTSIGVGEGVCEMAASADMLNESGAVNGGIVALFIDQIGGLVATTVAPEGHASPVTASLTINYLRPATGPLMKCRGRAAKSGQRVTFVEIEVLDERARVCATASGTWVMGGPSA